MTEPKRLLDDPSCPNLLREDLRCVQDLPTPPVDVAAGIAVLRLRIEGLGPIVVTPRAAFWGVGVVAGAVAVLTWWPVLEVPKVTVLEVSAAPSSPALEPPIEPTESLELHRPAAEPTPSAPTVAASRVGRRPPSGKSQTLLQREIAHLALLRRTLKENPGRALELAQQGQREFRSGMFSEERAAIAVLSLDALGRPNDARGRAVRFLQQYPKGPFSARLRAIANLPPGKPDAQNKSVNRANP